MKLIFTLLFVLTFFIANSQTVNDVPISEIDVEYVLIIGSEKLLSTQVTVELEFGQRTKFLSTGKETRIKDENGKSVKFNSMVDALNFMDQVGYEFISGYVITINNRNTYHYLMRRKPDKKAVKESN